MSFQTLADQDDLGIELTTTQVANMTGLHPSTVYDWAVSGRIPSRRDDRRRLWIRADQLDTVRQMRPARKTCPQCHMLARLLSQWGETPLGDLVAVIGGDPLDVRGHLDDLVTYHLAEPLSGDYWRITPTGARFADARDYEGSVPLAPDSRSRSIDNLPNLSEYLTIARIIAAKGPISARAASNGTRLDEGQALRRAHRLERARFLYRPRPRLWAITPQGVEWLERHDSGEASGTPSPAMSG